MMLLETIFIFTLSNMKLPPSCGHIPLPTVICTKMREDGRYWHKSNLIQINKKYCGHDAEGALLAHEIVHYALDRCGMPDDEDLAVSMQYKAAS